MAISLCSGRRNGVFSFRQRVDKGSDTREDADAHVYESLRLRLIIFERRVIGDGDLHFGATQLIACERD